MSDDNGDHGSPFDGDRGNNEIYMLLVEQSTDDDGNTNQLNATPVSYNLSGEKGELARALTDDEAPANLADFITDCRVELDSLAMNIYKAASDSDMNTDEIFVRLLSDFQLQPVELIHNMLASVMVAQIEMEREAALLDAQADLSDAWKEAEAEKRNKLADE